MSLRYSSLGRASIPPMTAASPASMDYMGHPMPKSGFHTMRGSSSSNGGGNGCRSGSKYVEPNYFSPDELASELTLLDLDLFRAISPDELTSCSWNKKNKLEVAANVVAMTRRFNHVSFWVVQEVLRPDTAKARAEMLAHFIKVAKWLNELNSLHSEFAILSAMQSASVWRLNKTWAHLSRKDRQMFDKLTELFSEKDNFSKLREVTNAAALSHQDCIPYLGLYLTDMVYVDMAHPHSGGLESHQRQLKMNNILRIVSELQQASYSQLSMNQECRQYLRSIRYIDELQKFLEDDQWKRSLQLEPNNSVVSSSNSSSKESVHSRADPNVVAELNLSPAKVCCSTLQTKKFVPGHRKSRSDGGSLFWACTGSGSNEHLPSSEEKYRHHLLDGSLLDPPPNSTDPTACPPRIKSASGSGVKGRTTPSLIIEHGTRCIFEGVVKRKTLIKEGRRPTVTGWQRYWLELWGSSLVFYAPKALSKGTERTDFKSDPCKFQSILSWFVMVASPGTCFGSADTTDQLSFQLTDPIRRNVYRFRANSPDSAKIWVHSLHEAVRGLNLKKATPTNLISFE